MESKKETIIEHLSELRRRLLFSLIFFLLSFLFSFLFAGDLYRFLTSQFKEKLIILGPDDILKIYMMLSSIMALTISLPFIVFQTWLYIKPALDERESKALLAYIPAVFVCFILGLLFGFYIVTPGLLKVLLDLGENLFIKQMTALNYITFIFHTTLPIAIIFEFPIIMAFLTSIGLINVRFLIKIRRYAYFTLIVLAVILTPADILSDLILALPLLFIYEIGIVLSRIIERRKARKNGIS